MPDELTDVMTTPAGAGAVSTSVLPSTGRRPATTVDVVLVVRDGAAWVPQCLEAIAAQQAPIDRLLVVDVASTGTSVAIVRAHQGVRRAVGVVDVLRIDDEVPIGAALALALEALPVPADPADAWVWVLDGGAPASPSTLARLLTAGVSSSSASR